ncbi:MAG: hypothetical protein LW806_11235, partial [Planctomycetaceae bacterium]|nr:hypothetical protein [Planctomycetaceae bacterium]
MTVHAGGLSGGTPREACVAPPVVTSTGTSMMTSMMKSTIASAATDVAHPNALARAVGAVVIASILV